jgi:riboflavin kinase/FMN adenylyltransferase
VPGDQRGRDLGFPTANIRLSSAAPALEYGVYAGRALGHPAAISVGVRPTFGQELEPLLEAHLLDFTGDLYGQEVTVEVLRLIRPELRFDSVDELVAQVADDIAAVREVVAAAGADET